MRAGDTGKEARVPMNIAVLQGNLATDVRLRTTTTGKEVASFKLAVNRPGKDAGADFVWVKVWNGSAVACEKYLAKGSPVLVDGSIRTSRIADGDGFKEYVEVNARQVTFLSRGNGNGNGASGEPEVTVTVETATPDPEAHAKAVEEARAALAALEAANAAEGEQEAVPATVVEDDDIPF
jgi:single-strand DNA-binding protein